MRRYRTTLIALAVLAVVAGVFVTVMVMQGNRSDEPAEDPETGSTVRLFSFAATDIIGFESKYKEVYAVEKVTAEDGDVWKCTSNAAIELYDSSVSLLTRVIATLQGVRIADVEDYTDYGFTDGRSEIYIKIRLQDGEETLYVGDITPSARDYYVVVAGTANTVYRVSASYVKDLLIQKEDLINLKIFTYESSDTMQYFLINMNGEKCLEMTADYPKDEDAERTAEWSIRYPLERAGANENINSLLSRMRNLTLNGIEEEACEDLSRYGLDKPAIEYYLSVENAKGGVTLYLIRVGNRTESGSAYYCTVDDSGDVYTVPTDNIAREISAVNYMSAFIFLEDSDNLSRVDFELSGETYEMRYEYETVTEKDENGEETEKTVSTRFFNGKEAPDDDEILIVRTKGYNYVPFTEEHRKLNKDDDLNNDVLSANPYEAFNHLLGALYYDLQISAIVLDEPAAEEIGEKLMTVKYTRTDGTTCLIELFKRDNTTAWIYANGEYEGGYCRTTSIFGDDYENFDVAESIVALKAVMALVP